LFFGAQRDGCAKYEANGQFAMVYFAGSCQIIDKINIAIEGKSSLSWQLLCCCGFQIQYIYFLTQLTAGAIGILFRTSERIVGRLSRVPVTSDPPTFPVVLASKTSDRTLPITHLILLIIFISEIVLLSYSSVRKANE
jgi:hypothetical protein